MKIVVLAHNLCSAGGLSVGKNIIATLPKVAPMHRYLMVIPRGCDYVLCPAPGDITALECPKMNVLRRRLWERVILRRAIEEFAPNWIWALGNIAIERPPCKQSLLLHNPHRVYPVTNAQRIGIYARVFKWVSDRYLRHSLRWVDRMYCQTESMRMRAHEALRYPLRQIGLCPNAFTMASMHRRRWPVELEMLRGKFILFTLCRYYPHKNLELIVETFTQYRAELEGVACVLTIDGSQGRGAAGLMRRLHVAGLEDRIVCIGAISQERLSEFYHAADAMFLPTLLESFSGAYLEAMQLGVPVVTSDRDFAREVCGDAAIYIDPHSPLSVRDTIQRLRADSSLGECLAAKGRERVRRHIRTWPDILRHVLREEHIETV